ncbi:hypothetical protein ZYGR_0AV00840 [Zygosaccharomyces rouxii]|uniref:Proteasome assembly chaperone 2 n=1 Tax=Zygosaccharomyces rouxii TaxID=4956 RepID=A0A1Q3AIW2_ZYGRO|nr:hypothetical protein ZYGR_0AV00840 [Zygosaccharomyces rouxii]
MSRTLLVPLVSTGNVPQLTTDLVLHSLSEEFQFVKDLDSTYLHPFVGPLDYVFGQEEPVLFNKSNVNKSHSTALELFYNESKSLYVIQQRTPVIQGYLNNFVKEVICPLVKEFNITDVVILDSFGALDDEVVANTSRTYKTNSFYSDAICQVGSVGEVVREMESGLHLNPSSEQQSNVISTLFQFTNESVQQEVSTRQQAFKFAYHLLNSQASELQRIKYCSAFVHEGDNSYDAHLLCDHLPNVIDGFAKINVHTPPISWKGVYGTRPIPTSFDEGIYI